MIASGADVGHKRRRASTAALCAAVMLIAPVRALAQTQPSPASDADASVSARPEVAAPDAGSPPAAPDAEPPPVAAPPPAPAETAPLPAPPNDEVRHGIGVRLGLRAMTVREDLLVPLTFSGGGFDLGAGYRGLVGPGLLDTRLQVGAAVVANRFGHLGLTIHHSLAAAYRVPVHRAGSWRYGAGAAIGESSDSLALKSWDEAHGYWVGLVWLGPSGSVEGPLGKGWQLAATAELALLGTVGRPPEVRRNKQDAMDKFSYYAFDTNAHPSFFLPWDVQFLRFDVAARRTAASDRVGRGWSLGWQGRFTHARMPATILVFESVLYAGWTWGL
jgi:hypothetical protein